MTRLRHAQKRIFKAQRRLVVAQALFWPTVVLASTGAVAAAVMRYRGRETENLPTPVDGLPHL
ncbi:hypothetical protein [Mycobacterium sp. E740]|uniref:hypothetical protein n=1 Tax=Mycobacterium sp. E740 TaxID=1834149 RepID=UPI001E43D8C2|nr:hypothetical protein [Mycobacterium sp. E740]